MRMITISEVAKQFDTSTRTLRYYEQIGLLPCKRKEDSTYRVYDEKAINRLQQIIILRKLRIPLKQIASIFENNNKDTVLEIFQNNIEEFENEIRVLNTITSLLEDLKLKIKSSIEFDFAPNLISDDNINNVLSSLTLSKTNFKEVKKMNQINEIKEELKQSDVRIVLLPPCKVVSYHFIGENPEETVGDMIDAFVRKSNLYVVKPDARMFGFNNPNPSPEREHYGYEVWVTIPDNMEAPEPLVIKEVKGGLYAAHTIAFGDFYKWSLLQEWVDKNEKYTFDYHKEGDENISGCLEEHLNWIYSSHMKWPENGIDGQLDLLLPIKMKD